jgi:glycosyltransferase involved in cell wall biosynthesis
MDVCLDVQPAVAQRAGVGQYTRHLADALAKTAGTDTLSLFYFDFKHQAQPPSAPGAESRVVRWLPGRIVEQAWKRLRFPPFEWFAGLADLYHFPNFILPPLASRAKTVVTIHDMAFMKFPAFAEDRNRRYLEARIRDTVRRADAVITDSEASATDIRELLGVEAGRVHAIPLGVNPAIKRAPDQAVDRVKRQFCLTRPYLLSVSTLEPRKNLAFMIDVFDRIEGFDGELVLAGMPGWKCEPIFAAMRSARRASRIRYIQYVCDADLPALYTGATAFLCTSHYEGFGLPPVEAMACGTPVVSSGGGALAEVLGDAATVVTTLDPEAWVAAVLRVVGDQALRARLVEAGAGRAAGYSWEETARRTWAVYRGLAG